MGRRSPNSKRIKVIIISVPNGMVISIPLVDEKIVFQEGTLNELNQFSKIIRGNAEQPLDTSEAISNSNEICLSNFDEFYTNPFLFGPSDEQTPFNFNFWDFWDFE